MTMMNERLDNRMIETPPSPPGMMEGNPSDFFATRTFLSDPGVGGVPLKGIPYYNIPENTYLPAGEMLQERMADRLSPQSTVQFLPDLNIDVSTTPLQALNFDYSGHEYQQPIARQPAPDLFELNRLARNDRAMQQQEGLGIGSTNPTPYISSLEGIPPLNALQLPQLFPQPANEMMNQRMNWQQSPAIQLGQSPAELLALQDMTRQSSSGYTPTNIWDYNPMWPVQSMFDSESSLFPMTPGTQGFLDLQDPLFLRRLNEGYMPALSNIANAAMYTNPFNAWLNLATRNR